MQTIPQEIWGFGEVAGATSKEEKELYIEMIFEGRPATWSPIYIHMIYIFILKDDTILRLLVLFHYNFYLFLCAVLLEGYGNILWAYV